MTRKITEKGWRGWRALGVSRKGAKFAKGMARGGGPRNDTEDHGKGNGVVLVLSAAVLVIVIDARDVGRAGIAREGLTRSREGREGFLGVGWRAGVDHEIHELHEK
jgi:hypothetical protein